MKSILSLLMLLLVAMAVSAIAAPVTGEVRAVDAFEVERILNPKQGVAVVIYSNPAVQDRTREAGLLLHQFVGKSKFQFIVLVDLRKTMADWAMGYTKRRIQRDLMEKFKALPALPNRDLEKMGHPDVSAVADFKGQTCNQLGWMKPEDKLRVLIFSDGAEAKRWDNLTQMNELPQAVKKLISQKSVISKDSAQ